VIIVASPKQRKGTLFVDGSTAMPIFAVAT